jgi:predicted double-glycine peptidase
VSNFIYEKTHFKCVECKVAQLNQKLSTYKEDKFYKRWMNGLKGRTKENYNAGFQHWLVFIGMTPTEQIQKRMHDLTTTDITERQFFEDKFRQYKTYLENKGDQKAISVKTQLIPVASFFSRNGLKLQLKRGDWESNQTQEVRQRLKLTRDEIRAMYLHANLRNRGLLLTLAQSGLSEVDVSCLKIEDFPKLYTITEGKHLFFEKPREKTGEMQATCLSAEALHDIKAILEERGNPEKGYLFVSQTLNQGEQLPVRAINMAMKKLAVKTFKDNPEKAKQFKTKALRSFYNSALLKASIQPQEVKDLMFGHQRRGARGHYDYDEETILMNYKRAFEYLGINGIQTRSDVAKLKAEFEATKLQLAKTISEQEKKLEEATQFIYSFEPMLNTFNEIANTTEGQELIKRIHEAKLKRETKEAQQDDNKLKAEIEKKHPVPKKVK